MDMLPPQAPPAISTSEQAETLATIRSIVANRQWQREDASGLPPPEEAVSPDGREAFLVAVDAFWNGSTQAHGARKAAWADAVSRAMSDLALLGERDGTLAPEVAALARRVLADATHTDAEVRELRVGDRPYAGALAVLPRNTAVPRLLFTLDQGWEAFDDADEGLVDDGGGTAGLPDDRVAFHGCHGCLPDPSAARVTSSRAAY